jgi:adenylosuccinate synthase
MTNLETLLGNSQVVAIVCNQWGDTGKGKFVDYFAEVWADVIARGTGGANAGHTIVINGREYIFHLIPSGILHDDKKKINIIGNGTVLYLPLLVDELKTLKKENKGYDGLRISDCSHITTPDDIIMEFASELSKGKGAVGTTMRGIGTTYADKISRIGIRASDLSDRDNINIFSAKLREKTSVADALLKGKYKLSYSELREKLAELEKKIPFQLAKFVNDSGFEHELITKEWMSMYHHISQFVTNTQLLIKQEYDKGKKILLEGAQGLLLSIDHGTYPYVTSSDCSAAGLASGVGIPPNAVDRVFGIAKMFYMTRVGEGPFPTEIASKAGDGRKDDEKDYDTAELLKNAKEGNDSSLRRYIRIKGSEYGASTGRPRRIGWLDLVALRYAIAINGPDVITTKTDVLDNLDEIKLCTHYTNRDGQINNFPSDANALSHCSPVYKTMPGWKCDTSGITDYNDLPENKRKIFEFVENSTGGKIRIVSVGPDRNKTIIRE